MKNTVFLLSMIALVGCGKPTEEQVQAVTNTQPSENQNEVTEPAVKVLNMCGKVILTGMNYVWHLTDRPSIMADGKYSNEDDTCNFNVGGGEISSMYLPTPKPCMWGCSVPAYTTVCNGKNYVHIRQADKSIKSYRADMQRQDIYEEVCQ